MPNQYCQQEHEHRKEEAVQQIQGANLFLQPLEYFVIAASVSIKCEQFPFFNLAFSAEGGS